MDFFGMSSKFVGKKYSKSLEEVLFSWKKENQTNGK